MENLNLYLDEDKTQSLEDWINDAIMPTVEAIGIISEQLEALYQELK